MWASTATGTPALTLTARRSIIKPDSCNSCHGNLGGFTPTPTGQTAVNGYAQNFHNQYNNDPTSCVLCHTPNGVSYGFSYNAKEWMHGIHSNGFRAVPYTVHDTSQYWRINYPAILNNCEACHVPGSYDFSNGVNAGQIPSMLWDTVAANIAASGLPVSVAVVPPAAAGGLEALVPPATGNFASPWITIPPGGTVAAQAALETEFGAAYTATPLPALPATVWTPTPAGPATLVTSPLTAACSACHNDQTALTHMVVVGGGVYYQARMSVPLAPVGGNPGAVNSPTAPVLQSNEQCLICHGPGTAGDIRAAHINF
jgi:OmcA/MtrC family decaheme c-type cytochrome